MTEPVVTGTERPGQGSSIAIAGASGYVGRLLTNRLVGAGHHVSALGRHVDGLPTGDRISAASIDVADPTSTTRALAGTVAAYYLVHAMAGGTGFEARDRELAGAFVVFRSMARTRARRVRSRAGTAAATARNADPARSTTAV